MQVLAERRDGLFLKERGQYGVADRRDVLVAPKITQCVGRRAVLGEVLAAPLGAGLRDVRLYCAP